MIAWKRMLPTMTLLLIALAPVAAQETPADVAPAAAQDTPAAEAPAVVQETPAAEAPQPTNGLVSRGAEAFEGYTLFAPLQSRETVLVNLAGEIVHRWTSEYTAGQSVYLLENGDILRGASEPTRSFQAGGAGGRVERFDWEGNLIWTYVCSDELHCNHHDIEPLPNGNILLISWERKSSEEAVARGRDAGAAQNGLWPDSILEIEPTLPEGGRIVWEWHVWDHLIQDRNPDLPNFGVVAEHPGRIDINAGRPRPATLTQPDEQQTAAQDAPQDAPQDAGRGGRGQGRGGRGGRGGGGGGGGADWNHINAVSYNADLDQILLSAHSLDEIFIIDHSTTTEEAAGSTGGRSGRGGDLLWRWGNPSNFGHVGEKQLDGQHNSHWIGPGLPGAGNILVYNNVAGGGGRGGRGGGGGNFSAVLELVPPLNQAGTYDREGGAPFGPAQPTWSYGSAEVGIFSQIVSGSQRLPNGNTLITTGTMGDFREVTPGGDIAWQYVNPIVPQQGRGGPGGAAGPGGRGGRGGRGGGGGMARTVFRAIRYAPDFPAFEGRF